MTLGQHQLRVRIRSLCAFVAASMRKRLGIGPRDKDFSSQRICPSCSRITPRFQTLCMECGSSLKGD
jgi:predicted amidophosphoribosyltransferase